MKKLLFLPLAALMTLGASYQQEVKAQAAVIDVLGAGISDADKLMNAYFKPFGETFSLGLGQNWYNTAKPLKLGRFNVQLGASLLSVPEEAQTFNPNALGMQNLVPLGNSAPTILAETSTGPDYVIRVDDPNNPGQFINLDTLTGLTQSFGLTQMAAPFAQFNIGLIKGTELSVRFVPTIDLSTLGGDVSGKVGLWGIGVKHDIKQWIPVINKMPFSLSGYFNYTKLSFEIGVSLPGPEGNTYEPYTGPGSITGFAYTGGAAGDYASQAIAMDASAMGFGIVASKKLLMFTPYASLGFQSSNFSLRTAGEYAILSGLSTDTTNPATLGAVTENYTVFEEPLNLKAEGSNALRYGVGLRVKLLIFGIHAEYFGVGGYSGVNAGLSIGF